MPLFDHCGQCVGAISLAGPASRLLPDRLPTLADRVRRRGNDLGTPRLPLAGAAGGGPP